jgi:hypothetical protein
MQLNCEKSQKSMVEIGKSMEELYQFLDLALQILEKRPDIGIYLLQEPIFSISEGDRG